jgi:4'-phosphopantetheinyl transferase
MWSIPPTTLTLANHEVHVWRANLDLPLEKVEELAKTLSADEQLRAQKFYFEKHRRHFIVGRGMLRNILGNYLAIEPKKLQFNYSHRGKPELAKSCPKSQLQFNLSHSHNLALYGFVWNHQIGIDLEYLRPVPDAEQIAKRFFSAREYGVISSLPVELRQLAFFRGWTSKEAYLKGTGDGLAGSLDSVEVALVPREPVRLLSIQGDMQAAANWSLYSLEPASNYLGTLAVKGHNLLVNYWQW